MLIRCYPRIHLGLIDLGGATFRRYGGAGFTLSSLSTEVVAVPSRRLEVSGLDNLDTQGQQDLISALERLSKVAPSARARITIKKLPPQHIGLGTKTALLLGAITAAGLATDVRLPSKLVKQLSGRGGASGVGVNTFFSGGFLTDVGHSYSKLGDYAPSSSQIPLSYPPAACRVKIPSSWVFYLLLPGGQRYSGISEVKFFRLNTPIPRVEVMRSLALTYHGVVPAVLSKDLALLKMSIHGLQRTGFKRRELEAQPDTVKSIIEQFKGIPECAAGVSSMGPLVYIIADKNNEAVKEQVNAVCREFQTALLDVCMGRNRGYEVSA
jgi:beta-ribofuranosylaminobenzene 5'-phosphate synthase